MEGDTDEVHSRETSRCNGIIHLNALHVITCLTLSRVMKYSAAEITTGAAPVSGLIESVINLKQILSGLRPI